jgi:hypothetical protein
MEENLRLFLTCQRHLTPRPFFDAKDVKDLVTLFTVPRRLKLFDFFETDHAFGLAGDLYEKNPI